MSASFPQPQIDLLSTVQRPVDMSQCIENAKRFLGLYFLENGLLGSFFRLEGQNPDIKDAPVLEALKRVDEFGAGRISRKKRAAIQCLIIQLNSYSSFDRESHFKVFPRLPKTIRREMVRSSGAWRNLNVLIPCSQSCTEWIQRPTRTRRQKCGLCKHKRMHSILVGICLAWSSLQLPSFVIMWIVAFLPELQWPAYCSRPASTWDDAVKLRIIDRVRYSTQAIMSNK